MKKQHSRETKHIQNNRDRYGKKITKINIEYCKLPVCDEVTLWDISQYCRTERKNWEKGIITFRLGASVTTTINHYSSTIWYYNGFTDERSKKEHTIAELYKISKEAVPAGCTDEEHWDMMEKGMIREWERRQTKLYKALC
jgi:hypothetical protein